MIQRDGKAVTISMVAPCKHYNQSPYQMMLAYLWAKALLPEFTGLRPYHMAVSGPDTFDPSKPYLAEIVIKKVHDVQHRYFNGSLEETLMRASAAAHLFTPFQDSVGTRSIPVSMKGVSTRFGRSPTRMLDYYIRTHHSQDYDELSKLLRQRPARAQVPVF